jgi:hypothetical protein
MENYLSGRNKDSSSNFSVKNSDFRSFSDMASDSARLIEHQKEEINEANAQLETVYSEGDSPIVEVLSVDGCPQEIIIHMNDGRLLKIACKY